MPATLAHVRKVYGERAAAMGAALRRELGAAVSFEQPQGGLFFWASLTGEGGKTRDAGEFAKKAIEQLVAFVPGAPFYAAHPDLSTFRLSFATADVARIEEGMERLGRAL
jgi:DNA-binding transcriptional MocR family regulator